MKSLGIFTAVIMTVAVLMTGVKVQAQTNKYNFPEFKPKSPEKATKYSTMSMVLPIIAGIAWLKIDSPKTKTVTRYSNGWPYTYTNTEEPDRSIPIILIVSGVVLGPSAGYLYGGCPERGGTGVLIRVGTGVLTVVAASAAASASDSDEFLDFSGYAAAAAVGAIGSVIILVEAVIDIIKVKNAIIENNSRYIQQNGAGVTLLPTYFADFGAGGMQLNVTF